MLGIDPPAKQVQAQPSAVIFKFRLIAQEWCAESSAQIFSLHQLCLRICCPYRLHGQPHALALSQHRAEETWGVGLMRVPVAIQATEPSRGQRLVYWIV